MKNVSYLLLRNFGALFKNTFKHVNPIYNTSRDIFYDENMEIMSLN
jgi:hypothetical protein